MENFIKRRLADPRFDSRTVQLSGQPAWVQYRPAEQTVGSVTRHNASAAEYKKESKAEDKADSPKKKKRRKKASGSGSETDSGSGSDDGNPCWSGYRRKPGTKKYADGSCVKA